MRNHQYIREPPEMSSKELGLHPQTPGGGLKWFNVVCGTTSVFPCWHYTLPGREPNNCGKVSAWDWGSWKHLLRNGTSPTNREGNECAFLRYSSTAPAVSQPFQRLPVMLHKDFFRSVIKQKIKGHLGDIGDNTQSGSTQQQLKEWPERKKKNCWSSIALMQKLQRRKKLSGRPPIANR